MGGHDSPDTHVCEGRVCGRKSEQMAIIVPAVSSLESYSRVSPLDRRPDRENAGRRRPWGKDTVETPGVDLGVGSKQNPGKERRVILRIFSWGNQQNAGASDIPEYPVAGGYHVEKGFERHEERGPQNVFHFRVAIKIFGIVPEVING